MYLLLNFHQMEQYILLKEIIEEEYSEYQILKETGQLFESQLHYREIDGHL